MKIINWLLESDSFVQYATRLNILKENKYDLLELRNELLTDERIMEYLKDVSAFNSILVTNHKNPNLPIHKLIFLLDIGLDTDVLEIKLAIDQILENIDGLGMYRSMTNVSKHFGGSGENTLGWALCDAPLMLHALLRAGISYEEHIQKGVEYIVGLYRENGFPCVVSKELGKFRGPGRKDECCPFATLIMLNLLKEIPQYRDSDLTKSIIDNLLDLWQNSYDKHPYMFYAGKDFRKLKAPTNWYNILSVSGCLSHFEYAKKDKRFQKMIDVIEEKANSEMQFIPESIYLKCKAFDFGQKKVPSAWLTYKCLLLLIRVGRYQVEELANLK